MTIVVYRQQILVFALLTNGSRVIPLLGDIFCGDLFHLITSYRFVVVTAVLKIYRLLLNNNIYLLILQYKATNIF